jgi:hypothetical protein
MGVEGTATLSFMDTDDGSQAATSLTDLIDWTLRILGPDANVSDPANEVDRGAGLGGTCWWSCLLRTAPSPLG